MICINPLLFVIVMEIVTRELQADLPQELLYTILPMLFVTAYVRPSIIVCYGLYFVTEF